SYSGAAPADSPVARQLSHPMKIAINAISIRQGGSVTTLEKLLSEFVKLRPQHEYHLIANNALRAANLPRDRRLHYHYFVWAEHSQLLIVLWYLIALPGWLKRNRIDVLFSH